MAGEPLQVRFLEGGRAQQTPAAVFLDGRWQDVRLLAEALLAGPDPSRPTRRRFVVLAPDGRRLVIEGGEQGWRLAG